MKNHQEKKFNHETENLAFSSQLQMIHSEILRHEDLEQERLLKTMNLLKQFDMGRKENKVAKKLIS